MMRRLLVAAWFSVVAAGAGEKPNVLFLFADDQVFDALGCMSGGYVRTPNLDRLAARGVHFERAYNMGAWGGAVCVASRSQLNTGLSLWRAKEYAESAGKRGKRAAGRVRRSWSERMAALGYHTYFTGKWHIKAYQAEKVFDEVGTVRPGMPRTKGDHERPVEGKADSWSPSDPKLGGYWEGGKHWSEVTAEEAIGYLHSRGKADDGKPFFAYVAFNAPHDPRQAAQAWLDRYPVDSVPLPAAFMPSYPHTREIGIWGIRGESLAPRPRTAFAVRTHRREYYALISHLDAQVGRIIAALDEAGMAGNTVVVFSADHGLSLGSHSFFCKQSMYDHSLAAPFVIAGAGIPAGKRSDQRIYIQDVVPTVLELAGGGSKELEGIDFRSLLPLDEEGRLTRPERRIYGAYRNESRCVIDDGWKLVVYPKVPCVKLFDLREDPNELKDLAGDAGQRERIGRLVAALAEEQEALGDDGVDVGEVTRRAGFNPP